MQCCAGDLLAVVLVYIFEPAAVRDRLPHLGRRLLPWAASDVPDRAGDDEDQRVEDRCVRRNWRRDGGVSHVRFGGPVASALRGTACDSRWLVCFVIGGAHIRGTALRRRHTA